MDRIVTDPDRTSSILTQPRTRRRKGQDMPDSIGENSGSILARFEDFNAGIAAQVALENKLVGGD